MTREDSYWYDGATEHIGLPPDRLAVLISQPRRITDELPCCELCGHAVVGGECCNCGVRE